MASPIATSTHAAAFFTLVAFLIATPIHAVNGGDAGPWDGFPRTSPTPRYENDPGADPNHKFGVTKAFSPYQDPNRSEADGLPSPLDDPDFADYNLIVVVSTRNDDFWGRGESLRVYKRDVGLLYYWLVSTGMPGHDTARGYFTPKGFSSSHWSREYDAPMMWSVFFRGGEALHSSLDRSSIADMGKAAESHGCIHEEDYRAEEMFHLVGHSGYGLVSQINESTGRRTGKTLTAYKTLIIIGPTTRWDTNNAPTRSSSSLTSQDTASPVAFTSDPTPPATSDPQAPFPANSPRYSGSRLNSTLTTESSQTFYRDNPDVPRDAPVVSDNPYAQDGN